MKTPSADGAALAKPVRNRRATGPQLRAGGYERIGPPFALAKPGGVVTAVL